MLGRVGQALRMAGSKVRSFDDAYADKVAELIARQSTKGGDLRQGINAATAMAAGAPATRVFPVEENNAVLRNLMGYGVPALNAGVRYGVPLLGAKLAADGIGAVYDAAAQTPVFGQNPADDQSNLMVTYVR